MDKPIFYCDCDGVIMNTIEIAFQIMKDMGCNLDDKQEIDLYFKSLIDWREVFNRATFINDSIDKIKLLKESNVFSDVIILTKLSGGYHEEGLKRDLFSEYLPDTRIITLQFGLSKAGVVRAKNNVLIDDEKRNCDNWKENAGTAILFSTDSKDLKHNVVNDLMDITKTKGVKKLLKTRNF